MPIKKGVVTLFIIGLFISIFECINIITEKQQHSYNFPSFQVFDIHEQLITSSVFRGDFTVIIFIDPRFPDDNDFIFRLISEKYEALNIIAITDFPDLLKIDYKVKSGRIIIFNDSENKLREIFRIRHKEGFYLLFGKDGSLIASGLLKEGFDKKLKIVLNTLLRQMVFSLSLLCKEGDFLEQYSWLSQLQPLLFISEKQYVLFILFSYYCGSCGLNDVIEKLNDFYLAHRREIEIIGILNSYYYNQIDVDLLKEQSQVIFPLVLSDKNMSSKWNLLIADFSREHLNCIGILSSQEGKILKVGFLSGSMINDFLESIKNYFNEDERVK